MSEEIKDKFKDGEFISIVRISTVASFLYEQLIDHKAELQRQIDLYLAILPKGTKTVSVENCGVTDLSITYEVKFYNPLLKNVKKVDLDYVRAVQVIDGKLEQFNLFLGIRYFDSYGNSLYNL